MVAGPFRIGEIPKARDAVRGDLAYWFGNFDRFAILFAIIVNIRCWSLFAFPEKILWTSFDRLALILLVVQTGRDILVKRGAAIERPFAWFIKGFLLFSVLNFLPAYFVHSQNFVSSLNASLQMFYWLVYFQLHSKRIEPERILRLALFIGCGIALISVVQQFTYPYYIFYTRFSDEYGIDPIEYRAGVYRFMLYGAVYLVFAMLFFANRSLNHHKRRDFLVTLGLLAGLFYYGTRQFLFVGLLGVGLMTLVYALVQGRRLKLRVFVVLVVIGLAAAFLSPQILEKFIELTVSDMDKDNIRVGAMHVYLYEFWNHWICYFLGNGIAMYGTPFGQEVWKLWAQGYFQSDIGIVGTWSTYGIFYVLIFLSLPFRAILTRMTPETRHFRYFFVCVLALVPIYPFSLDTVTYPFFSILLYLLDHHVKQLGTGKGSVAPQP